MVRFVPDGAEVGSGYRFVPDGTAPEDMTGPGVPGIAAMRKHMLPDPLTPGGGGAMPSLMDQMMMAQGVPPAPAAPRVPGVPSSGLTIMPKGGVPREGTPEQAAALKAVMPALERFEPVRRPVTAEEVAGRAITNKGLRMLTHLPNVPGHIIDTIIGVPGTVPRAVTAEPEEIRGAFTPGRAAEQFRITAQHEREYPWTKFGAEVIPDVAAIAAIKAPIAGRVRAADQRVSNALFKAEHAKRLKEPEELAEKALEGWKKKIASPRFLNLKRGGLRLGETTMEGYAVGLLNDDDPLATAGLAAMGQASGSAVLHLANLRGPTPHLMHNAVIKSVYVGGLLGLLTGGYVLKDIEAGFDKTKIGAAVALTAAAVGAGRGRGGSLLPARIQETVASIPRGATLSVLNTWLNKDEKKRERMVGVLNMMQTGKLPPETVKALGAAMDKGGPTFDRVMDRLVPEVGMQ